ncbi:hypothetical protein A9Q99_00860 [Gammaproteobacteria bacterium 45_16_T64]|nr:hypothetical protein A9Q99_00860 [Gammaproteobacteria bacterium 45_16_T64]
MEESLRQRLVGALVLFLLAIIFLPLVLDGRDEDHKAAVYRAPQEPVIHITHQSGGNVKQRIDAAKSTLVAERAAVEEEDVSVEVSPPPSQVAEVKKGSISAKQQKIIKDTKANLEKEVAITKKVKAAPKSSKAPLADAWTVQVAAFAKLPNAKALQSQLIQKSYMAYIESNSVGGKRLHRVYVGPELRKNRARIIQQALKKEFKLAGMIKTYQP